MKISEMIIELKKVKAEHGDLVLGDYNDEQLFYSIRSNCTPSVIEKSKILRASFCEASDDLPEKFISI